MTLTRAQRATLTLAALVVAIVFALPIVWMVGTSVKPLEQVASTKVSFLPDHPARTPRYLVENYVTGREAFVDEQGIEHPAYDGVLTSENVNFTLFFRNTLIVALLAVSGMVVSSAVVAYGFSKVEWCGRGFFFAVMLATMMIPFPAVMVPTYFIFKALGWIGTLTPLWAPAWFAGAFNVFLLRQFFMQIPAELSDAARIDGLGHWGIFWRIILPLSRPALAVVALLHFIFVWNDFLAPLVYLHHQDDFTLAIGLQFYLHQHGGAPWNQLMAACTLAIAPLLILFVLTQQSLMRGITQGAVKG